MIRSRNYIAVPPGATIKEQLDDRGMSQKEFAARMGMSEKHISHLINGDVQLTPETAYRLETVLGLPARFWNRLEALYREEIIKAEKENAMDADKELVKKFPYNEMAKLGWLRPTQKTEEKVNFLRQFFEVVSLDKLENEALLPQIACRRLSVTEKTDFALLAWAQKAKLEARNKNVSPIDLKELKKTKNRLMKSIVVNMEGTHEENEGDISSRKLDEDKRLIDEVNVKMEEIEDELIELPRTINSANQELMLESMRYCYERLRQNSKEADEITAWIDKVRVELKKNIIKKQNREINNRQIYSYMHEISFSCITSIAESAARSIRTMDGTLKCSIVLVSHVFISREFTRYSIN